MAYHTSIPYRHNAIFVVLKFTANDLLTTHYEKSYFYGYGHSSYARGGGGLSV